MQRAANAPVGPENACYFLVGNLAACIVGFGGRPGRGPVLRSIPRARRASGRQGDRTILSERPSWVVSNLPGVPVGIDEDT